jgi:hypothetical protein
MNYIFRELWTRQGMATFCNKAILLFIKIHFISANRFQVFAPFRINIPIKIKILYFNPMRMKKKRIKVSTL